MNYRPRIGTRVRLKNGLEGVVRLYGPGSYDLDMKIRLDDGTDVWEATEDVELALPLKD